MDELMEVPHKRSTSVTVEYKPKKTIYLTEWSSNGIPIKDNKLEFTVTPDADGKVKLDCKDQLTNVKYVGERFESKYEKYMVLVVDDEKATLQPCSYFRMKPKLELPLRTSGQVSSLSYKEQMDEINEKFGSKKTIRRIEERRKNAIAYGAEDYKDMKEKAQELTQNMPTESTDKKAESSIYDDPFLIPPRNESALQVDKVYNVNDIVPVSLIESLKASYNFTDIKPFIKSPMVDLLVLKAKSETDKASCLFLDALIQFKALKPTEINRADVLGIGSYNTCTDLVHTIIKNYSISTIRMGKPKRALDEKCKDKVIIHSIILCVMLNNYRPLLVSALAQAFQTSVLKIKKFGNIVGCHVDMNNSKTDRVLSLRLPLYTMDAENKYKRRKTR